MMFQDHILSVFIQLRSPHLVIMLDLCKKLGDRLVVRHCFSDYIILGWKVIGTLEFGCSRSLLLFITELWFSLFALALIKDYAGTKLRNEATRIDSIHSLFYYHQCSKDTLPMYSMESCLEQKHDSM